MDVERKPLISSIFRHDQEVDRFRAVDSDREEERLALRFDLEGPEKLTLAGMHFDAFIGEHHLGVTLDLVRMKRRLALFDDAEPEVDAAVRTSNDRETTGELFGDDLPAESLREAAGRDHERGAGGGVLDHARLKARRRDVFRAEVEVHRAVVEEKVGIVLDDPRCVEAEPSRDVGPGVARAEELNEEALVRFVLDETGVAPLRVEATDARLVVGELQRGAALGHLLAEGLEAVLEQREAE